MNPSTLRNGKGKIRSISNSEIEVEDSKGGQVVLKLGACTRIESGERVPKLGQRVYWKGN